MSDASAFVIGHRLPDIEYRTNAPEEIVCPRVVERGGVPMVYIHKERGPGDQGFVPVAEFLSRLARSESGLSVTGYRANGRQTTISFNKADRVAFSPRLKAYLSSRLKSPAFDSIAVMFVDRFLDGRTPLLMDWRPRYAESLELVRSAIAEGAPERVFERIWKSSDNSISNAGQGILGFDEVERLREPLIEMIRSIALDGSATSFSRHLSALEGMHVRGELSRVPRLLLARAFAAIHPEAYHTTVDAAKQDRVIQWFAAHSGFVDPEGNWATRARALTAHLDASDVFGGDRLSRNMFPWFVFDQLRDLKGDLPFRPNDKPRSEAALPLTLPEREVLITRRHNVIQNRLFDQLRACHGSSATVAREQATGTGGHADILVKRSDGSVDLYEIKPAKLASVAVRQALGQLLEYAYWPGGLDPASLTVVSDAPADAASDQYLKTLESNFGLKIAYLCVSSDGQPE